MKFPFWFVLNHIEERAIHADPKMAIFPWIKKVKATTSYSNARTGNGSLSGWPAGPRPQQIRSRRRAEDRASWTAFFLLFLRFFFS